MREFAAWLRVALQLSIQPKKRREHTEPFF
jgi:hypothetical protein